ncbi:hypothetical protein HHL16_04180 [Pseudoflavitalea sp. G-6-1-2]|uniref:hypothetical protein n=1 Tax=Pseudoflavitalea sp. G-6-1-2 TaxID=2728841 RepID=UPI00146CAE01|nr:hypothetical protein [Pseudoflavitalea sp. G-6-1-2]NML20056.1 hypothetical protein [Pseudoflavitalea sp. G-6-1-2]
MRSSYILGFLLILCTSITNMAVAQETMGDAMKRRTFMQEVKTAIAKKQTPAFARHNNSKASFRRGATQSSQQKAAILQQRLAEQNNNSTRGSLPSNSTVAKQNGSFRSPAAMQVQPMQTRAIKTVSSEEERDRLQQVAIQRENAKPDRSKKLKEQMEERFRQQKQQ